MTTARVEVLIWVLVYVGLGLIGLGLAVLRRDATLGAGIVIVGGVSAAIGVVLIWVRSRMKER